MEKFVKERVLVLELRKSLVYYISKEDRLELMKIETLDELKSKNLKFAKPFNILASVIVLLVKLSTLKVFNGLKSFKEKASLITISFKLTKFSSPFNDVISPYRLIL